jgi:ABC-2 type transport system ATP-binding protein
MVRLDRLAKRFGPLVAVDDVSFSVDRGEVLGFLGPNGAGKSTTMRMLAGFVTPTSGTASVAGHDVVTAPLAAKQALGYLPEGAPAYGDMSVLAFLRFVAELRGVPRLARERHVADAIAKASLEEVAHQPVETLSKGFKRRVGIAQAIVHDPPVLVMDEPTDGLDPNQKHEVRALIRGMARDKAIIVSTHILEEVEAVCTRAVIIARGRIVADATPEDLKRRSLWHNAVRVEAATEVLARAEAVVKGVAGVREVRPVGAVNGTGTLLVVPEAGRDLAPDVHAAFRSAGIEAAAVVPEQGRLDDVFRALTTGSAPGGVGS